MADKYALRVMPPVLNRSNSVCMNPLFLLFHSASLWPSSSSRHVALNLCFGHCLLSLHVFNPFEDVWVRVAYNFFHSRMPSLNMVVGSRLMLIEVVPVNWWKVSIDPGGSEIIH